MAKNQITSSSTAEYFAKNLQQVGFSSPTKAVLTTLKEAVDNSLDACEQNEILPEIHIEINKVGTGAQKNTDLIDIIVTDNGPGLEPDDLAKVFGEYLASSKFGRGQCTRGQQGIGISAATTWAQLTNARGAVVTTKTKSMRKAVRGIVDVDIKGNKGILKNKETIDWDQPTGVKVEFRIDGRIMLNGEGGLLTYLEGTTLVNPHLSIHYRLPDQEWVHIERVSTVIPDIPESTLPHPHTMKLGEFITHSSLYGKVNFGKWLTTGFSRISDGSIQEFIKKGMPKQLVSKPVPAITEEDFKKSYQAIQATELMAPSTRSVLTIGEEGLSKSIRRIGDIDFFSVVTRKPCICDFKPVVIEVALARFQVRGDSDDPVRLLRFANRVPLQFDKGACAITKAIETVNWRSYGLNQPKNSLPVGPYIFAISVTSPFIKFKNASKETIDASDELVEEIRRALMQAGQKLSRHIRHEDKQDDLERKLRHIEQFGPILVEGLVRISKANKQREQKAVDGLKKILGRDTAMLEDEFSEAEQKLKELKAKTKHLHHEEALPEMTEENLAEESDKDESASGTKKTAKKTVKNPVKKAAPKKVAGKKGKK